LKKALLYFGGATLCLLLGYVVAVVLFKRVPAAGAPFAVAGYYSNLTAALQSNGKAAVHPAVWGTRCGVMALKAARWHGR
jgi:hypothetical protein